MNVAYEQIRGGGMHTKDKAIAEQVEKGAVEQNKEDA
jgi:hypothetical protein